jgi:hypothetical protein
MKKTWISLTLVVGGVLHGTAPTSPAAPPAKGEISAGWAGVFPELGGYQRSFLAPVVAKGKKPTSYRQTARYVWTGGAAKTLDVTLARDAGFRKKYAAAVLKKAKNPPKEVRIGKGRGWLWDLTKDAGNDPDKVRTRLVVPLAADKVLLLEARGPGPWEDVTGLARQFNQAAILKALASPPRIKAGKGSGKSK